MFSGYRAAYGVSLIVVLSALWLAGCETRSVESAPQGATAIQAALVGPVPGPVENPPQRQNPYADEQVAMQQGRKLFVRYNCAGCHGGHAGGGMGPSLRDQDWMYGNADAQIFSSIAQGRANGMPAWGQLVPEGQIWQLVSYIHSLRTPEEPEPPKP